MYSYASLFTQGCPSPVMVMESSGRTFDLDLDEVNGISRVLTRNRRIERAIELYLSTADGAAMLRPERLPDARDLDIAVSELPPVYEPPAEAVARISELYREQVPVGD